MDELIKWLKDVGAKVSAYPDELYKVGVELCGKYSKNRAIMATFRVGRPTPLHKKLLRNTLMRTAALLERRDATVNTKEAPAKKKVKKSQQPKAPAKPKKTVTQKPTPPKKNAKDTPQ